MKVNWNKKAMLIVGCIFLAKLCFSQRYVALLESSFTKVELDNVDTFKDIEQMSENEKLFGKYLNLARFYPKKFATFYKDYIKLFDSEGYTKFKRRDHYYYSLYIHLNKMDDELYPLFYFDQNLQKYAKCFSREMGERGIVGHNRRQCKGGNFYECVASQSTDDPMEFLLLLLIDEDIRSLNHRNYMLLSSVSKCGISINSHKKYGKGIVLDFL